jgi:hypothetical protein
MKLRPVQVCFVVSLFSLVFMACGQGALVTDPVAVTRAMFDAVNRGQSEKAAGYFSADAEIVTGFGQPTGSRKIEAFFKTTVIPMKTHAEIKDLKADGVNVTGVFLMKSSSDEFKNATPMKIIAVVLNGKISSMTWTLQK